MSNTGWKARVDDGREAAETTLSNLSSNARDAAEFARLHVANAYDNARDRVGDAYDNARHRTSDVVDAARERLSGTYDDVRDRASQYSHQIAERGSELGARAAEQGKKALDRAKVSSRDTIADRPLTVVAAGLVAGVALGFIANQMLQRRRTAEIEAQEDDFTGG